MEDESKNSAQISLPLDMPLREAREHFDSLYFNYQMQKESGNISRIAEKTGIERTHLYRKLKQLGIKPLKKRRRGQSVKMSQHALRGLPLLLNGKPLRHNRPLSLKIKSISVYLTL